MVLDIVPYKSIDKVASWAKSAYHGWRFSYGLQYNLPSKSLPYIRPVSACVTSASTKDYPQLDTLWYYIKDRIGVLIGDAGYFSLKVIRQLWQMDIVLQPSKLIQSKLKKDCDWMEIYNDLKKTTQVRLLYRRRKPSIELK